MGSISGTGTSTSTASATSTSGASSTGVSTGTDDDGDTSSTSTGVSASGGSSGPSGTGLPVYNPPVAKSPTAYREFSIMAWANRASRAKNDPLVSQMHDGDSHLTDKPRE